MLYVMRGQVMLRLFTILTILTFFPSSVGAWTFTDEAREVVVRTERATDPLANLPWETVEELERGPSILPWKDEKRVQVAAKPFQMDGKLGSLFGEFETSPVEPFHVADARTRSEDNLDRLRDEVMPDAIIDEPAVTIPTDVIEQAIRETQERLLLAQAEQTEEEQSSAAAQLEQEAEAILGGETEEPKPSSEVERFILAQAETEDPWEGSTLSSAELLALAQQNIANNQPVDAALNCLELIDRFPRTIYAVGGNTILEAMADEFRKGNYAAQDVATFEAAMPSFNQLQSLDGKYNILGFHRIKAKQAAKAGQYADGRALLELCVSEAQTLMDLDPANPLQIDIMRIFMNSSWEYSPTEGYYAAQYLQYYLDTQPRNIGRWAAKHALKKFQGVQGQDTGAARLAAVDLLGFALNDAYVADAIGDPTVYGWVKASLQYAIADSYVTLNRWQDALDKCDEILEDYPSAKGAVEAAELMKCYIARRTNGNNLFPAITAYYDFTQNYPDSEFAKNALWMVGNLYFQSEDYTQAASYYADVMTQYPGTPVAIAAADTIDYMNAYLIGTQEVIAEGPEQREPWMVAQMCGPLALQKLLSTQGIAAPLKDLAERTGVNNQGTSMLALVKTAKHYGVTLTGVELASLESLRSPFIAYVNNDHFVLVKDIEDEHLTIADSWKEDEVVLAQEFEETWNGQALILGKGVRTAQRIDIAALASAYGGFEEIFGDDGEDESCGQNNDDAPGCLPMCYRCGPGSYDYYCISPCESGNSQNPMAGGSGASPSDAVGGLLSNAPVTGGVAGAPQSALGYQGLDLGITSAGINARVTNYTSALSLNEADLAINVVGPMSIVFMRNYYSRRGYHLSRRTVADWYGNNIGSGWVHNWNIHLNASEGTEAQGQPSTVMVYDEIGNADQYDFDQRVGAWNVDIYRPNGTTVNTQELGNVLVRYITTEDYRLTTPSKLRLDFSAVDSNRNARLESVSEVSGTEITLAYDGAVGTGKLTKIDAPSGDSRFIQLSYSGDQITKAELKKSSTVLQEVLYAYNASDELTKVTDDGGEDILYAYDSDGTYTNSRFITKITDKLGYEYDFAYTFKTHHVHTSFGMAYVIDVDYPNGLETSFDRSNTAGGTVAVTNWDGATALNKTVYHPGGTFFRHEKIDFYRDGSTYDRWEYEYSSDRDLTKIKRPGGVEYTTFSYNSDGRISTNSHENVDVDWDYDASTGMPTKRMEVDGTETKYFYDGDNRITKVTHPSYATNGWRYEYDGDGNRTKTTTPGGEISTVAYDAMGNPTSQTNPLSHTTTFAYDDLGRRTKVTDPLSNDTEFFYDGAGCGGCASGGNMTKIADADGNDTKAEYDLGGRRTKAIDPRGIETTFAYNTENRLTKITAPAGGSNALLMYYDKPGRQTKVTDFRGYDTISEYNFKGQLTKQSDPIGDTEFTYNAFGNVSTLTDAESQVWIWTYDSNNRLQWTRDDELKTLYYRYDSDGRMTKTDAGLFGGVDPTIYSFNDATGLMTKVEYVSGTSTHDADYHYDGEGQVTKVADWLESGGNARLYGFDDAGRLTKVTEPDLKSITYSYDSAGRVTSINDYQSKVTSYTYTDAGRLSTITAPGSKTWDYDHLDGFLTKYSHPNGMSTNYEYNDRSRLTKIEHMDGSTVKQGFTYTLDDNDNVTDVEYDGAETWEYFYDGRNRLTKAERDDDSATLLHRYTYTYDDADNMVTKQIYNGTTTSTDAFAYSTANELTKHDDGTDVVDYTYDAWGRMVTKAQDTTYKATYAYRYGSKLYSVTSDFPSEGDVTYDYGDDGQRKSRTAGGTTTNYYYDSWNVINEKTGSTWTMYTFDKRLPVGNILSQVDGNPATGDYVYYAHDNLSSTRALYDQSKAEVANYENSPYGGDYASSGSASTKYRFTGKGWDSASLLYHSPYRYYSPGMGGWISRDPWGMVDGPNLYRYALGNPVRGVDSLGTDVIWDPQMSQPPNSIIEMILHCMANILPHDIRVTSGTRPGDDGQHGTGNAADIGCRPGVDSNGPSEVKDAFFTCADWYAPGSPQRICRHTGTGHIHIDLGPGSADCDTWGPSYVGIGDDECDC